MARKCQVLMEGSMRNWDKEGYRVVVVNLWLEIPLASLSQIIYIVIYNRKISVIEQQQK